MKKGQTYLIPDDLKPLFASEQVQIGRLVAEYVEKSNGAEALKHIAATHAVHTVTGLTGVRAELQLLRWILLGQGLLLALVLWPWFSH